MYPSFLSKNLEYRSILRTCYRPHERFQQVIPHFLIKLWSALSTHNPCEQVPRLSDVVSKRRTLKEANRVDYSSGYFWIWFKFATRHVHFLTWIKLIIRQLIIDLPRYFVLSWINCRMSKDARLEISLMHFLFSPDLKSVENFMINLLSRRRRYK